jgi:hypothetical protein
MFAERGLAPAIEEGDGDFTASLDIAQRVIAGDAYVIDRRPNRPPHDLIVDIPGPRGFRLEISLMPMLPQIMTQYASPPTPRGGVLYQRANQAPDGEVLSHELWFAPERQGSGPYLVIEIETGVEVPADFADAMLDCIVGTVAVPR